MNNPVRISSADYFRRLTFRLRDRLPMWVVYDRGTREYPESFVARMHITLPRSRPTRFVMLDDSLEGLRRSMPVWMTRLERHPNDAPEIMEIWI